MPVIFSVHHLPFHQIWQLLLGVFLVQQNRLPADLCGSPMFWKDEETATGFKNRFIELPY